MSRVPREGEGDEEHGTGAMLGSGAGLLSHNIQACLKLWRRQTWVPPFCFTGKGNGHNLRTDPVEFCGSDSGKAHVLVPSVNRQVQRPSTDLGPSLLEHNALSVARARSQRASRTQKSLVGPKQEQGSMPFAVHLRGKIRHLLQEQ